MHTTHARLVSASTIPCTEHARDPADASGPARVHQTSAPELEGCRTIVLPANSLGHAQKSGLQSSAHPIDTMERSSKAPKLRQEAQSERTMGNRSKNNCSLESKKVAGTSLAGSTKAPSRPTRITNKSNPVLDTHQSTNGANTKAPSPNRPTQIPAKPNTMRAVGMGSFPVYQNKEPLQHTPTNPPNTLLGGQIPAGTAGMNPNPRVGTHGSLPIIHQPGR